MAYLSIFCPKVTSLVPPTRIKIFPNQTGWGHNFVCALECARIYLSTVADKFEENLKANQNKQLILSYSHSLMTGCFLMWPDFYHKIKHNTTSHMTCKSENSICRHGPELRNLTINISRLIMHALIYHQLWPSSLSAR